MSDKPAIARHYTSPGLLARIEAGLAAMGKGRETVSIDELAPVDEFHVRGPQATAELIGLLGAAPGMHVLDAGSGLGGPARRLAQACGCRITGIDLSEDYCAVGATLNQWTALDSKVDLVVGDVTDLGAFPKARFDAAWTIHASMNIADKPAFYRETARVLKSRAKFVMYDILACDSRDIDFPVPWAMDDSASFLASRDDLQTGLESAGFQCVEFIDRTAECRDFLEQGIRLSAEKGPQHLGLHLLFGPAFRDMIGNLARNFADGRVAAAAVTCRKAD